MEYERFYQFFKKDDNQALKQHKIAVSETIKEQKEIKKLKELKDPQNLQNSQESQKEQENQNILVEC